MSNRDQILERWEHNRLLQELSKMDAIFEPEDTRPKDETAFIMLMVASMALSLALGFDSPSACRNQIKATSEISGICCGVLEDHVALIVAIYESYGVIKRYSPFVGGDDE
jgi:hypothetical protein